MKRVVKYLAKDGTEFESVEMCSEHDRRYAFTIALTKFLTEKLPNVELEDLQKLDAVGDSIYKNPTSFLSVVEAAIEPPKRGRPRKDVKNTKIISEKPVEIIPQVKNTFESNSNSVTTPKINVAPHKTLSSAWRSYVN